MPNKVQLDQDYPRSSPNRRSSTPAPGLIPAFAHTLAKGPTQYVDGVAPKYLQRRAKGARVWDVDGNEYLDYNMAIGPISLGYGYDIVNDAIRRQLEDGIVFPLIHPLEVETAELMREVIPNAESCALCQGRGRSHQRRRPPGPRLHRPRQSALLRLPRLA
jgi:glutamate-1-semialdehyde 2,1-aminomutase